MESWRATGLTGAALVLILSACTTPAPDAPASLRVSFLAAIKDAAVPEPEEASDRLRAVAAGAPDLVWRHEGARREILVAVWMSDSSYQRFYAAGAGRTPPDRPVVWVTLAPQVRDFCRRLADTGLEVRLKQHLGLSPEWRYDRFVELWVDPSDMFRPCPDPEPTDTRCELGLPKDDARVPRVADYRAFFADLSMRSYRAEGAPWTRLGYTYDWAPGASEIGASEFMLAPDSTYTVARTATTVEYCRP